MDPSSSIISNINLNDPNQSRPRFPLDRVNSFRQPGASASGLELLLLISSLMFLVLLAIALATGLYFVHRRRRGIRSSRHAAFSHQTFKPPSTSHPAKLHKRQAPRSSFLPQNLAGHSSGLNRKGRASDGIMSAHWTSARRSEPLKVAGRRAANGSQQLITEGSSSDADGNSWPADSLTRWEAEHQLTDAHLYGLPYSSRQYSRRKIPDIDRPSIVRHPNELGVPYSFQRSRRSPIQMDEFEPSHRPELWRTKSWTSGRRRIMHPGRRQTQENAPLNSFGAESSRPKTVEGNKFWTPNLMGEANRVSFAMPPRWTSFQRPTDSSDNGSGSGRDEDGEGSSLVVNRRPRLIVRSIEDSYITKISETERQEWMSRDNRQPLSLNEWRSMQPKFPRPDSNSAGEQDEPQADDEHESTTVGGMGNLRSLSEIDISFARQMGPTDQSGPQQQANQPDRTGESANDSSQRSTADLGGLKEESGGSQAKETSSAKQPIESPDLIVSPEYEVEGDSFDRLRNLGRKIQLRSDLRSKSSSPGDSVSYV